MFSKARTQRRRGRRELMALVTCDMMSITRPTSDLFVFVKSKVLLAGLQNTVTLITGEAVQSEVLMKVPFL